MKRIVHFLLLLLLCGSLAAQNSDSIPKRNEIGLVFTDVIDGGTHFRYERRLKDQFSYCVGVGYKGRNGLISSSGINSDYIHTSGIKYSGFKIIPELRYYLKNTQQNNLNGFYIGLYVKSSSYFSNVQGTFNNLDGEILAVDVKAKLRIVSSGINVGYKLALSPKINVDFMIAGPGIGNYWFILKMRKSMPPEFYDKLNDALKDYSYFEFVKSDFEFNYKTRRTSFKSIAFRYGIAIGYRF